MVKLIVGRKGTGKTKMMVDAANQASQEKDGSIVFIIKDDRLKHDLDREIRMIVMDEFEYVTNIDESDLYTALSVLTMISRRFSSTAY